MSNDKIDYGPHGWDTTIYIYIIIYLYANSTIGENLLVDIVPIMYNKHV